ncbi:MAG: tRNA lysidine(34) synthetase TilS [Desulfobacteraceae bacterium]|nr:tRNA lysidine(34) synthetase TilS [Desulfobacteraceae bacterium]
MEKAALKKKFLRAVEAAVCEFKMLEPGDPVLAAVSGGPDSVALLLSLLHLKKTRDLSIGIAHLNHRLRGEDSLKDEEFVRDLAEQFRLPFFCRQEDVAAYACLHRLSVEEAGREVRYDFFSRTADHHGYHKIALGHNKNDNAELVLMNLLRGSGSKGLSGIPPVRDKLYIRPLIRLTKQEILDFLKAQGRAFRIDGSNTDTAYIRNAVRLRLIPVLESDYNPDIVDALDRLSHILRQEEDYLDTEAEKYFQTCLIEKQTAFLSFSKKSLSTLHPAMVNRVIRKGIGMMKTDLRRISLGHMNDILDFCFRRASGNSLDLPGRIRIYKKKDAIMIKKEDQPLRDIGNAIKFGRP